MLLVIADVASWSGALQMPLSEEIENEGRYWVGMYRVWCDDENESVFVK